MAGISDPRPALDRTGTEILADLAAAAFCLLACLGTAGLAGWAREVPAAEGRHGARRCGAPAATGIAGRNDPGDSGSWQSHVRGYGLMKEEMIR